jgi:hypothetical protein
MNKNHKNQSEADKESQRILDRVNIDSETVGTSSMVRSAEKARDHFLGKDADPDDPIEIWGKRIGRVLSIVIVAYLITYLYNTFFV